MVDVFLFVLQHSAYFVLWTFVIYWMHRLMHFAPVLKNWHWDHHVQVYNDAVGWSWKNLFLWFDSWDSTLDQWVTEVIPTVILGLLLPSGWWLIVFYYIWAAFIQEVVEHNPKFDLYPIITSGRWHLVHHADPNKNYGVFFPIWDMLFGTYMDMESVKK